MRLLRTLALGGTTAVWAAGGLAGTASGVFSVHITLHAQAPAGGICVSQSLSEASNATVQVVCGTGQFVSIEPAPGKPFFGTRGAAYRLWFGPGSPLPQAQAADLSPYLVSGTITGMQVLNLKEQADPLEILVSF